jgi:hypothetical protein
VGRLIGLGVGALGAYGLVSALMDGNDVAVPEADHAKAKANAKATLDRIDWNRPIIALTVAGTGWGNPPQELVDGLTRQAGADRVSISQVTYPATAVDMLDSVALGKETLRLVLEEIERRDPDGTKYHVALSGESQGAWVINDVLAEHPFAKTVDRAGLYGLPADVTYDGAFTHDDRVRITNHPLDPIAWHHLGPATIAAQAPGMILGHDWNDAPAAALEILLNPVHAALFGAGYLYSLAVGRPNGQPHLYTENYEDEGARFMLQGAPARER